MNTDKRTDVELNIAIAEATGCEWKDHANTGHCWHLPDGTWIGCNLFPATNDKVEEYTKFMPHFCNELQAIQLAERRLIEDDHVPSWVAYLVDIVIPDLGWANAGRISAANACLLATARQRAEALVKTLNL